jgi:hypothetical protein
MALLESGGRQVWVSLWVALAVSPAPHSTTRAEKKEDGGGSTARHVVARTGCCTLLGLVSLSSRINTSHRTQRKAPEIMAGSHVITPVLLLLAAARQGVVSRSACNIFFVAFVTRALKAEADTRLDIAWPRRARPVSGVTISIGRTFSNKLICSFDRRSYCCCKNGGE